MGLFGWLRGGRPEDARAHELGKVAKILDEALARHPAGGFVDPEELRRRAPNLALPPEMFDAAACLMLVLAPNIDGLMRFAADGNAVITAASGTVIRVPASTDYYDEVVRQIRALERVVRQRYGEDGKFGRYQQWLVNTARDMARGFIASYRPARMEDVYPFAQILVFSTWIARLKDGTYDDAYEARGGAPRCEGDNWKFREYVLDERELS